MSASNEQADLELLKNVVSYKRAEHLCNMDREYSEEGTIITAVDYSLVAKFVDNSVSVQPKVPMEKGINMGPKLNWATLVHLFTANYKASGKNPLLLLPGHLGEVEKSWNASLSTIARSKNKRDTNIESMEKNLSVEIMAALNAQDFIETDRIDYSEIAIEIQKSLQNQFSDLRVSEVYSTLMDGSLFDLSSLFTVAFGDKVNSEMLRFFSEPNKVLSPDLTNKNQIKVLRWAQTESNNFNRLPTPDKLSVLSLLILNETLFESNIKIVLLTDSNKIHESLSEYKFYKNGQNGFQSISANDYCARDLKSITNTLLRDAEEPEDNLKHYWADFILEHATKFPVSDRSKYLWSTAPAQLDSFVEQIFNSFDYEHSNTDEIVKAQLEYGENIAKEVSIDLVDQFRKRDVEVANEAAVAWGRSGWQGILHMAQHTVTQELNIARQRFIKSSVLRLVARKSADGLEGPFRGRFFACLFLEDFDRYKISETINRVNESPLARTELIERLEIAANQDERNERINYLKMLGAALLYADLGHWNQASLLCDEALVNRTKTGGYQGREALFLSSICHRMTAVSKSDLEISMELLNQCDELILERNKQLNDYTYSGIRVTAEKFSVKSCRLAFDVYSGKHEKNLLERVKKQFSQILAVIENEDDCSQENAKKWAEFSMRSTLFSTMLMLKWLDGAQHFNNFRTRISAIVIQQETVAKHYFGDETFMRISIRDGLLLMFAAKMTNYTLHDCLWIKTLTERITLDKTGTYKGASYLPFDNKRFKYLLESIES